MIEMTGRGRLYPSIKRNYSGTEPVAISANAAGRQSWERTRLEIAVLNKTSRLSSCAVRSMLCTPVERIDELKRNAQKQNFDLQNQVPR